MKVLEVKNLVKTYPNFELKGLSFSIEKGKIVGLIGRNGAGKSTILKCILNFVKSEGKIVFWGKDFKCHEREIKQKIGFVSGGFNFYSLKTLKKISKATSMFYANWDEEKYKYYVKHFGLDENKKIKELSEGMKVKFSIALALSHNAEILILDEPTSGLDPFSREEFCDIILNLVKNQEVTVLFSTHITSDLSKIADELIFISDGDIIINDKLENVLKTYSLIKFDTEKDVSEIKEKIIGLKKVKNGYEGLIKNNIEIKNLQKNKANIRRNYYTSRKK